VQDLRVRVLRDDRPAHLCQPRLAAIVGIWPEELLKLGRWRRRHAAVAVAFNGRLHAGDIPAWAGVFVVFLRLIGLRWVCGVDIDASAFKALGRFASHESTRAVRTRSRPFIVIGEEPVLKLPVQ